MNETVPSESFVGNTNVGIPMTPNLSDTSDDGSSRNNISQPISDMRFPRKSFYTINKSHESTPEVACWNESGDAFIIKSKAAFEEKYLSISFESFVRQLHLYGFKKVNSNKGLTGLKKKTLIFRHERFQQGREDLVCCMKTLKREKKMVNKSKGGETKKEPKGKELKTNQKDAIQQFDVIKNKRTPTKSTELVDESMHLKLDRMNAKVGGIYVKLEDLSVKFQTTLSLMQAAALSNSAQYQPIPIGNMEEVNENSKRRRYSHSKTIDDSKEELICEHLELSEIQLESVDARRHYDQCHNSQTSQLTLDTDEMKVIHTLMQDDTSCDVSSSNDKGNDFNVEYNNASEIKMQNENIDMPLIENVGTPILTHDASADVVAVEVHQVRSNESIRAARKRGLSKKKNICLVITVLFIVVAGLLALYFGYLNNNDNNDGKEDNKDKKAKPLHPVDASMDDDWKRD